MNRQGKSLIGRSVYLPAFGEWVQITDSFMDGEAWIYTVEFIDGKTEQVFINDMEFTHYAIITD